MRQPAGDPTSIFSCYCGEEERRREKEARAMNHAGSRYLYCKAFFKA